MALQLLAVILEGLDGVSIVLVLLVRRTANGCRPRRIRLVSRGNNAHIEKEFDWDGKKKVIKNCCQSEVVLAVASIPGETIAGKEGVLAFWRWRSESPFWRFCFLTATAEKSSQDYIRIATWCEELQCVAN